MSFLRTLLPHPTPNHHRRRHHSLFGPRNLSPLVHVSILLGKQAISTGVNCPFLQWFTIISSF